MHHLPEETNHAKRLGFRIKGYLHEACNRDSAVELWGMTHDDEVVPLESSAFDAEAKARHHLPEETNLAKRLGSNLVSDERPLTLRPLGQDFHQELCETTACQVQTQDGLGQGVSCADLPRVEHAIPRVHDNASIGLEQKTAQLELPHTLGAH